MLGKRDENGEVRPSWEEPEEEHFFDDLASGLASGTIPRGRALKLLGAALLGMAALPFSPVEAQARHRRHHHHRRGRNTRRNTCRAPGSCNNFNFRASANRRVANVPTGDAKAV